MEICKINQIKILKMKYYNFGHRFNLVNLTRYKNFILKMNSLHIHNINYTLIIFIANS
ncbi:hypothetical protein C1645_509238 [Glomus cerebriforme]|uniref:Uncharacterized protein n=1 Tax=Glomus cerebriforme TaxID=658196 RepID=A0A397SHS1_9GLOM|nr:hypothetical protein C1645_509238 [Glomus cerebriforme]